MLQNRSRRSDEAHTPRTPAANGGGGGGGPPPPPPSFGGSPRGGTPDGTNQDAVGKEKKDAETTEKFLDSTWFVVVTMLSHAIPGLVNF